MTSIEKKRGKGKKGKQGRSKQRRWKTKGEQAFLDFLLRIPVENIKPRSQLVGAVPAETKNRVVVVKLTDSVSYVWKLLATENFLSAPVVDATGLRYCGTIDVMDLLRFTSALFPVQTMEEKGILIAREFWDKSAAFRDATVATILQAAWFQGRATLTPTYSGFTAFSAWETMSKLGIHRLTVLNEMGQVANILTQSMCISVLAQNIQKLGSLAKDTVLQLGTVPRMSQPATKDMDLNNTSWSHTWSEDLALLKQDGQRLIALDQQQSWHPAEGALANDGRTITMKFGDRVLTGTIDAQRNRIFWSNKAIWYRTVLSCNESDVTIHAFNKMIDHNVTGLAIVNSEGTLTGSLSIRDLRGVGLDVEKFYRLYLTVKDFKEIVLKEFPQLNPITKEQVPNSALYVVPTDTLETVINKMNDGNIHRLFVVSQESIRSEKPRVVSILTQRDVMLYICLRLGSCPPSLAEKAPPVWNI